MIRSITLTDDHSEIIPYNIPDLPVKTGFSKRSDFPFLTIANHWHSDFEFFYVVSGKVGYIVDGVQCTVKKGQMIFVNSARLHYSFWEDEQDCEYLCTIFHPSLLDSRVAQKYLSDITNEKSPSYLILHPEIPREKELIDFVIAFNHAAEQANPGYEFTMFSCVYEIMQRLFALIQAMPESVPKDSRQLDAMHRMVGFIQQNYTDKITLTEIAEAGFVSKTSCGEIFKKYAGKPPVEYLNAYRIGKSAELLLSGSGTITEVAQQCGFCSASYYIETFRKVLGCTPTVYRQKINATDLS